MSAEAIRELLALGVHPDTIIRMLGAGPSIAAKVELFRNNPDARLLMTIARRSGIPFSEAARRWNDQRDLESEMAWDIYEAELSLSRCPSCGLDHDLVWDYDKGRPFKDAPYQIARTDCPIGAEIERVQRTALSDEERDAGVHYRLRPCGPEDPWVDHTG